MAVSRRELEFILKMRNEADKALRDAGGDFKKLTREIKNTEKAADRTRVSMGQIAGEALKLAGAITTAFFALNQFRQFEATMARVQAVTGATADQFADLTAEARRLGSETLFTAREAADGLAFLGQAGFDVDESISALEPSLKLAQAAMIDLGTAADIVSNIMSGFRLEADQTSRVGDILAATAANSNTNLLQLGEAMKLVAPIAAAVGEEIEVVSAAIGVLGNNGLQASLAGTGLRQVFLKLANPSKEALKEIDALGLTIEELDPASNNLIDILERLADAQLSAGSASEIFGARAATAVLALTANTNAIREMETVTRNAEGALDDMAAIFEDTLDGSIKLATSAITEILIIVGEELTPAVRLLAEGIQVAANAFRDLDPAVRRAIVAAGAIAGVTVAIRALVFILGPAVAALRTFAVSMVSVGGASAAFGGTLAFLANPIVAATVAIGALVAGMVALDGALSPAKAEIEELEFSLTDLQDRIIELNKQKLFGEGLVEDVALAQTQSQIIDLQNTLISNLGKLDEELKKIDASLLNIQTTQDGLGFDTSDLQGRTEELKLQALLFESQLATLNRLAAGDRSIISEGGIANQEIDAASARTAAANANRENEEKSLKAHLSILAAINEEVEAEIKLVGATEEVKRRAEAVADARKALADVEFASIVEREREVQALADRFELLKELEAQEKKAGEDKKTRLKEEQILLDAQAEAERRLFEENAKFEAEQSAKRKAAADEIAQQRKDLEAALKDLEFQNQLVGRTAAEQERLTALRQAELQFGKAITEQDKERLNALISARQELSKEEFLDNLREENKLLKLQVEGQDELVEFIKAEAALREIIGRDLLPKEQEELRGLVAEQRRMNKELSATESEFDDLRRAVEGFGDDLTDALTDLSLGVGNLEDGFKGVIDSLERELTRLIIKRTLVDPLIKQVDQFLTELEEEGSDIFGEGGFFGAIGNFFDRLFGDGDKVKGAEAAIPATDIGDEILRSQQQAVAEQLKIAATEAANTALLEMNNNLLQTNVHMPILVETLPELTSAAFEAATALRSVAAAGGGGGGGGAGGLFEGLLGGLVGGGGIQPGELGFTDPLSSLGAFGFDFGLADGGRVRAGQVGIVGEEGPEIFAPNSTGRVISNDDLRGMGGGGTNIVMNISTPDADSFRRSQNQIIRDMTLQMQRTTQRDL